jgi:hypothetical protein
MVFRIPFTKIGFGFGAFQYSFNGKGETVVTESWWPISFVLGLLHTFGIRVPSTTTIVGRVANGPIHKTGCTQPIFLTLCRGDIDSDGVKNTLTNPIWGTMMTLESARLTAKRLFDEVEYFEAFERKS